MVSTHVVENSVMTGSVVEEENVHELSNATQRTTTEKIPSRMGLDPTALMYTLGICSVGCRQWIFPL